MGIIPSIILVATSSFIQDIHENQLYFAVEVCWQMCLFIGFIIMLMACNMQAGKLLITQFDFWMKLYYSMGCLVANSTYTRCSNYHINRIIFVDLSSILIVFMVTFFSVMEGVHVSWKSITLL